MRRILTLPPPSPAQVILWHVDGTALQTWHGPRVTDMAVTGDGRQLILVTGDTLCFCALASGVDGRPSILTSRERAVKESGTIASMCLSADSRHLLVR